MNFRQHNLPHPGALIQRTYIDPFKEMIAIGIADKLGVARSTFSRLLNCKSNVSPEMAVRLSTVLGGSPESWLSVQPSFDLHKARQIVDASALERIDFSQVE